MNILEVMASPELFGETFAGESWEAWRAVLSGAFALPMDDDRLAKFKDLSGDREPPSERVRELWCIAGVPSVPDDPVFRNHNPKTG